MQKGVRDGAQIWYSVSYITRVGSQMRSSEVLKGCKRGLPSNDQLIEAAAAARHRTPVAIAIASNHSSSCSSSRSHSSSSSHSSTSTSSNSHSSTSSTSSSRQGTALAAGAVDHSCPLADSLKWPSSSSSDISSSSSCLQLPIG
jgi:hypothetical protein